MRAGASERSVLLGVWGLGVIGCLIGLGDRPTAAAAPTVAAQILDLIRILTTTALVVVLVLGPGLALRRRWRRLDRGLGYVPLPGLGLLAVTGLVAWLLTGIGSPHVTAVCVVVVAPTFVWLLYEILSAGAAFVSPEERWALITVGAVLGFALGKSMWSIGPVGELYGGAVSRTLEVGDRSDSAVSFHIVQLVFGGHGPAGALSRFFFNPYDFSARGPLAGLAGVSPVLLSGGRPPVQLNLPWVPFDPSGFMAYRIAMMVFASTAFLAVWTLTRRIGGERAARFALLLAATTPFLLHEVWFTWPKLLAATLALLAAVELLDRRPLGAGLLLAVGYLVHPLVLLAAPALLLLALWPPAGARLVRPRLGDTAWLLGGLAAGPVLWRIVNWSHYSQGGFTSYIARDGRPVAFFFGVPDGTFGEWLNDRLVSLGNTVVPLRQFLLSSQDQSVNTASQRCYPLCHGGSPAIVHFFFQYWTGVPFGMGIVFFPLLLVGLWRAGRRWPWPIIATLVIPFVAFLIYWGDASTGLMREGLHVWVLTVVVVLAAWQWREGFPWLRSRWVRGVLCARVLEAGLVAVLPAIVTTHRIIAAQFRLTDTVALLMLAACGGLLVHRVWTETAPG